MKTRNVLTALLLLSGSAITFSVSAGSYNDPNAGDSASNQQRQQVEVQRDQQQSTEQRVRELGYDASQYAKGLMGGQSEEQRRAQIQYDERNRNK